ncbi:surface-adhesin E family protein [Altericroceibacterium endophyticum]|uniref:Surface-adhesin protein E-like domain-containing protein n=1 Tax=Altericroceibacterium endophyticum TaxID=1808508 RepID=A0A6I4T5Z6_9SPHN|nr:surface-adhesin E family protein [Altericroceibacterium endophyticum]MXO66267.1 hypothetical protein [Altericroceibacterium endophyticum]
MRNIAFALILTSAATGALANPSTTVSSDRRQKGDDCNLEHCKPTIKWWEEDEIVRHWFEEDPPWGDNVPDHAWGSSSDTVWFNDSDIQKTGEGVAVWLHWALRSPDTKGAVKYLTRVIFDCGGRFKFSAQSGYDEMGHEVFTRDGQGEWKFIRPDSNREMMSDAVC